MKYVSQNGEKSLKGCYSLYWALLVVEFKFGLIQSVLDYTPGRMERVLVEVELDENDQE